MTIKKGEETSQKKKKTDKQKPKKQQPKIKRNLPESASHNVPKNWFIVHGFFLLFENKT